MEYGMNEIEIADLVPFEKQLTTWQYNRAVEDLNRDNKFDPPAKVFHIEGFPHIFVRDGHHHIRAALDAGSRTVPCVLVDPPDSSVGIIDDLDEHLALKGFAALPIQESRIEDIQNDLEQQTGIDWYALKKRLDGQALNQDQQ